MRRIMLATCLALAMPLLADGTKVAAQETQAPRAADRADDPVRADRFEWGWIGLFGLAGLLGLLRRDDRYRDRGMPRAEAETLRTAR